MTKLERQLEEIRLKKRFTSLTAEHLRQISATRDWLETVSVEEVIANPAYRRVILEDINRLLVDTERFERKYERFEWEFGA